METGIHPTTNTLDTKNDNYIISSGGKLLFYEWSNQIDPRFHFIWRCIQKKEFQLIYIKTMIK